MADVGHEAGSPILPVLFLGEFRHTLDSKGRMILPADFRDRLGGGGYVTKLLDGCLAVFPPAEFSQYADKMSELAREGQTERETVRTFAAASRPVTPDGQGRIALPQALREYAALDRDVVVTGAFNHVEIWNPDRWTEVETRGSTSMRSGQDSLRRIGL